MDVRALGGVDGEGCIPSCTNPPPNIPNYPMNALYTLPFFKLLRYSPHAVPAVLAEQAPAKMVPAVPGCPGLGSGAGLGFKGLGFGVLKDLEALVKGRYGYYGFRAGLFDSTVFPRLPKFR